MQHIHIMGIGGIGMSGIARLLAHKGYTVSGCDHAPETAMGRLHGAPIRVYRQYADCPCQVDNSDMIVHSAAIPEAHPELQQAQQYSIPILSRAEILPYITRNMFVIAVSGTHGKTTTTAIIGHMLIEAGHNPTVLVGGNVKSWNSNVRIGSDNFLVIEADESDKSLLQIIPDIAVITNLDYDHTQTYANVHETHKTFQAFLAATPATASHILCADDKRLATCASAAQTQWYGFNNDAHYVCGEYNDSWLYSHITTALHNYDIHITTSLNGQHNARNIMAAIAVGDTLNIPPQKIEYGINTFSGIARRCELTQYVHGVPCYDDYAHHPAEIYTTLQSLISRGYQNPCIIFQPHRYTRFAALWNDFIHSFSCLIHGHIYVTSVFSAGEEPHDAITAERFASHLQQAHPALHIHHIATPYLDHICTYIRTHTEHHDVFITLGAGDITQIHQNI